MWKKDGKIYPEVRMIVLNGRRIHNPRNEQITEAGYEWLEPEPPSPIPPEPKKYSKYKIILALGEEWPTYKAQIEAAGLYDLFSNAEYLEDGDTLFEAFIANVPKELKAKLEKCLWD